MFDAIKLLGVLPVSAILIIFVAGSATADITDDDWNDFVAGIAILEDRFGNPTEQDGDLAEAAQRASDEARRLVAHRAGRVYYMAKLFNPDAPKCVAIGRRLHLRLELDQTVEAVLFEIRSTIANMSASMGDVESRMGIPNDFSAFAYYAAYRDIASEMRSGREISEEALIPIWNEICVGRFSIRRDLALNSDVTFFELTQGRFHPASDPVPVLRVLGSIEPGYSEQFLTMLEQYPNIRHVEIAGPGGDVDEAMYAGRIIRARGLGVLVTGQCRSMCPFILMGDRNRALPHNYGPIGFHPVTDEYNGIRFSIHNPDNQAYERLMRYIYEMGGSGHRVVSYMLRHRDAPSDFYYPRPDELCAAGIVKQIVAPREFQSRGCRHDILRLSRLEQGCESHARSRSYSVDGDPRILRDLDERGPESEFHPLVAAADQTLDLHGCLNFEAFH